MGWIGPRLRLTRATNLLNATSRDGGQVLWRIRFTDKTNCSKFAESHEEVNAAGAYGRPRSRAPRCWDQIHGESGWRRAILPRFRFESHRRRHPVMPFLCASRLQAA